MNHVAHVFPAFTRSRKLINAFRTDKVFHIEGNNFLSSGGILNKIIAFLRATESWDLSVSGVKVNTLRPHYMLILRLMV